MSQRKPKKAVPANKRPESMAPLRRALARRKKAELVDTLLELAQADRGVLRQLTARFDVATASDALVTATHQAIADATAFDERDINRNFAYDYEAYGAVQRNLGRLIDAGQLRQAMQLALELMKRGSYQVEMSDEGLIGGGPQGPREVRPARERSCRLVLGDVGQRPGGLHRPGATSVTAKPRPGSRGKIVSVRRITFPTAVVYPPPNGGHNHGPQQSAGTRGRNDRGGSGSASGGHPDEATSPG
jgi:hypothetical protein